MSGTSRTFSDEKLHQKVLDGTSYSRRSASLKIADLDEFSKWLKVRRRISDDTIHRYIMVLEKNAPLVTPGVIMKKYDRWLYVACRLFVRYRWNAGTLSNDEKARWLDLLRIQDRPAPDGEEITPESVRQLLTFDDSTQLLHALYYSGIRITDAVHFFNNCSGMEAASFDGFTRYKVGFIRGMKRCEYCYLPSEIEPRPVAIDLSHFARRMPCNPKLLRKFFYRTAKAVALEQKADPLIADFYQSRLSRMSVGERHYGYLREEADALYPKVRMELKALLH